MPNRRGQSQTTLLPIKCKDSTYLAGVLPYVDIFLCLKHAACCSETLVRMSHSEQRWLRYSAGILPFGAINVVEYKKVHKVPYMV